MTEHQTRDGRWKSATSSAPGTATRARAATSEPIRRCEVDPDQRMPGFLQCRDSGIGDRVRLADTDLFIEVTDPGLRRLVFAEEEEEE